MREGSGHFMNDQIQKWLKLKPGKQVYAEFETRNGKHERNLGRLSGGGPQKMSIWSGAMMRMMSWVSMKG